MFSLSGIVLGLLKNVDAEVEVLSTVWGNPPIEEGMIDQFACLPCHEAMGFWFYAARFAPPI